MDFTGILLLVLASLTSGLAVAAVFHDRFQKPIASLLCLLSAVAPWFSILPLFSHFQFGNFLIIFGLFGATPVLLISFFLFGLGKPYPARARSAGFALTAMFSALITFLATFNLLSKME